MILIAAERMAVIVKYRGVPVVGDEQDVTSISLIGPPAARRALAVIGGSRLAWTRT
jgi:hypothetical protein